MKNRFEIYEATDGFRWRLRASNGETVCVGEAYTRKDDVYRAIETVRGIALRASVEEVDAKNVMPMDQLDGPEQDLPPFVHDGSGPDVDPATGDEAETFQPE